jgi:hypothetical protein
MLPNFHAFGFFAIVCIGECDREMACKNIVPVVQSCSSRCFQTANNDNGQRLFNVLRLLRFT